MRKQIFFVVVLLFGLGIWWASPWRKKASSPDTSLSTHVPQQGSTIPKVPREDLLVPVKPPAPANVPESLRDIYGIGESKSYTLRARAVHQLNSNLSSQEIEALIAFLYRKKEEENALSELQLGSIKNDIVNVLISQETKPSDLGWHLIAMYQDQETDRVWRDYCIQFLGQWYGHSVSREEKEGIQKVLWKITGKSAHSFSGTALIALGTVAELGGVSKTEVAQRAFNLAEKKETNELTRITALQICAELKDKKILPTARELAQNTSSVPLRMSAIAAVGTLGNEGDRPLLKGLAENPDSRLRTAASSALKRLKKAGS